MHDKDVFLRRILRELTGIIEQTVGERGAEAYINYVGIVVGRALNKTYRTAFATERLDACQLAASLLDLKARIDGGFSIESIDDGRIVLVNTRCPFGDMVVGRPSLCRMTANILGSISAENLGYARVKIESAIERGDPGCRVVVELEQSEAEAGPDETEFFGVDI